MLLAFDEFCGDETLYGVLMQFSGCKKKPTAFVANSL